MTTTNDRPNMPLTTPEEMSLCRAWMGRYFTHPRDLPLSFVLDGQVVRGIPDAWQPSMTQRRIDANITETVYEGADAATGLRVRVECSAYRDYPVVEWVAWLTNTGSQPTPVISDLLALDASFEGASPVLSHCNGDYYSIDGYTPTDTPLKAGQPVAFAPTGGRSCDGAFPYYRIRFGDQGVTLAIGWPAQWSARFSADASADAVRVQAGQEKTHLRLRPGERIRTPRITVMTWTGDQDKAVNLWRRWYLTHILPRPNGQPMRTLLALAATDEGEEFTAATEENQIRFIDQFIQRGITPDVWWIDAGWYPCMNAEGVRRWWLTGTWKPDPARFPNGMQPISARAAHDGASLLVWFEPERIQPGTELDKEHGEWLLRATGDDNALLNLGNPQCRQWLTDRVCQLIQDNGIKIYRQDHNFPPLNHWRQNEPDDRQGMNENLHVQGYLQFWDDLLARNPGLWIDSCSSGGRRNDLETMRRSVPLHYTDYGYGDHPVKLAFHRTLFEWIPYFKECTLSWDQAGNARFDNQVDSFSFHCGMAAMLFATVDIRRADYDFALAAKMIGVWRSVAETMLHGDYYAHTPYHKDATQWVAWQFDQPEAGAGFVQGIRLPASSAETLSVHLKGIDPTATYLFTNLESGERREMAGATLVRDGFMLALPPRQGVIWTYRR
jgi:alpha-galactosidase